jgi:hypothetical protein
MTSSPGTRQTRPRLIAARAPDHGARNLSPPSDAPRTSSPTSGRRPRIPSCLFPTLSNSNATERGRAYSDRGAPSGTRYIVSSLARLKAIFAEI